MSRRGKIKKKTVIPGIKVRENKKIKCRKTD